VGRDNGPRDRRLEYSLGDHDALVHDPDGHNVEAVHHDD
jgi:hypothetical protein